MKRLNKTMRRKRQRRQRSRRSSRRRQTRRMRGGSLPAPPGSIVAMSTGGEYGIPILMTKDQADDLLERGGLEE